MSDVSRIRYLAYGSNMWPRRIELRLGLCEAIGIGSLREYALRFQKRGGDGAGKCDAFHTGNPADTLYGVVYSLSRAQREMLDEFEGPGYASRDVSVRTQAGMLTAYAYLAKAGHLDADLRPFSWYKAIVVAGARAHGLPAHYIDSLAAVGASPDRCADREARCLAMLDREFTAR